MPDLGIRWTIGDVGEHGFEALRLSIQGAWRLFGGAASYAVCVNTLPLDHVRARVGEVPSCVQWMDATGDLPGWLRPRLDARLAEGAAWTLAPPRVFPETRELSLDNDCILWELPSALAEWLEDGGDTALVAEDVRPCSGAFSRLCGGEPRNLGIRGLPPGLDLEAAMRAVLREHPDILASELDEQGLQLAALSRAARAVRVVSLEDVTSCSPFSPHLRHLGRRGAHFRGLNGRPAEHHVAEHWTRHLPRVRALVEGGEVFA